MPEEQTQEVSVEIEAIANPKNFSTIPNSNSEFCIYTYKADYETYKQVLRKGFFNSASGFLNVGDTIRLFRFDLNKNLTNYIEFLVADVDKINKVVTVATISQHNIENKLVK